MPSPRVSASGRARGFFARPRRFRQFPDIILTFAARVARGRGAGYNDNWESIRRRLRRAARSWRKDMLAKKTTQARQESAREGGAHGQDRGGGGAVWRRAAAGVRRGGSAGRRHGDGRHSRRARRFGWQLRHPHPRDARLGGDAAGDVRGRKKALGVALRGRRRAVPVRLHRRAAVRRPGRDPAAHAPAGLRELRGQVLRLWRRRRRDRRAAGVAAVRVFRQVGRAAGDAAAGAAVADRHRQGGALPALVAREGRRAAP